MPHVSINGSNVFYDERGSGQPVVFIHGGFPSIAMHIRAEGSTNWGWELDFAAHFRFIMYHRRGCYLSTRTKTGYRISEQSADLRALMDHLQIQCAHIIGSSAGGPVAVAFAAENPDRVLGLVLAGTGTHLFPDDDFATPVVKSQAKKLKDFGAHVLWEQRPEPISIVLDELWERPEMEERGKLKEYEMGIAKLLSATEGMPLEERIGWYTAEVLAIEAYIQTDVSDYCKSVVAPTLVIHGENDKEVPKEWGHDLAAKISGSTFRKYSDQSHSPIQRSVAVRKEIMEFLSECQGCG
jgi:pimeloyl-ACP methyl ester carboxylesterase